MTCLLRNLDFMTKWMFFRILCFTYGDLKDISLHYYMKCLFGISHFSVYLKITFHVCSIGDIVIAGARIFFTFPFILT